VDAIEHLREILSVAPVTYTGLDDPVCLHCRGDIDPNADPYPVFTHSPDCPWLAAMAFVEEQDRPPKTPDQIRAEMDKIAIDSAKHGPPRHWGGY
jgi:hypothetical protein